MSGVPRDDWALLQPCGTRAAYRRHLRHGTRPCESCLAAERRAYADRAPLINAERSQRYQRARAAGMNFRQAKQWRAAKRWKEELAS